MTDLLLIRHGQATHNLDGRWVGWGATPLTEEGQRQAEALARRLASWSPAIACVYTSPLLRARQTSREKFNMYDVSRGLMNLLSWQCLCSPAENTKQLSAQDISITPFTGWMRNSHSAQLAYGNTR